MNSRDFVQRIRSVVRDGALKHTTQLSHRHLGDPTPIWLHDCGDQPAGLFACWPRTEPAVVSRRPADDARFGRAINAARTELLRQGTSEEDAAAFDDALLDTVTVPENPAIVGQTLRALRVPHRTGTVVVGISRQGSRQVNPSGDDVVYAGDQWLVIGSSEELRSLKVLLTDDTLT